MQVKCPATCWYMYLDVRWTHGPWLTDQEACKWEIHFGFETRGCTRFQEISFNSCNRRANSTWACKKLCIGFYMAGMFFNSWMTQAPFDYLHELKGKSRKRAHPRVDVTGNPKPLYRWPTKKICIIEKFCKGKFTLVYILAKVNNKQYCMWLWSFFPLSTIRVIYTKDETGSETIHIFVNYHFPCLWNHIAQTSNTVTRTAVCQASFDQCLKRSLVPRLLLSRARLM